MATPITTSKHRTISDYYADRELTDAQVRRLVALLGLARAVRRAPEAKSA